MKSAKSRLICQPEGLPRTEQATLSPRTPIMLKYCYPRPRAGKKGISGCLRMATPSLNTPNPDFEKTLRLVCQVRECQGLDVVCGIVIGTVSVVVESNQLYGSSMCLVLLMLPKSSFIEVIDRHLHSLDCEHLPDD